MAPFKYEPLYPSTEPTGVTARQPVRLALLLPGRPDDDLCIILAHSELSPPLSASSSKSNESVDDEQGQQHNYADGHFTALSYVWGSEENLREISVRMKGGTRGTLGVTQNLEEALRHLRDPEQTIVLWIDAICIDQKNEAERSKQVAFMAQLYNNARNTVVWLGPEGDDGEFALKLLKRWGDHLFVDPSRQEASVLEESQDPSGNEDEDAMPQSLKDRRFDDRESRALLNLLHREWFERLWVRQEFMTRTPVSLRLGNVTIGKATMTRAILCLCEYGFRLTLPVKERPLLTERLGLISVLIFPAAYNSFRVERLRYDLVGLKWGKPVDAIYAFLFFLTKSNSALKIVPDYKLPVDSVFRHVAVQYIQSTKSLALLEACELATKTLPNLPSWVPDWSSQIKTRRISGFWSASAWISAIRSIENNDILRAAGIRKTTVRTVSDFGANPEDDEHPGLCAIDQMLHKLPDNLSIGYIGGGDLLDAYTKTFANNFREQSGIDTEMTALDDAKDFVRKIKVLAKGEDYNSYIRASGFSRGLLNYLDKASIMCQGRSFITTDEGYIGLGPRDTKPGDVVTVMLGCNIPMMLRRIVRGETQPTNNISALSHDGELLQRDVWQVVGSCHIPGLMRGETIYGADMPDYINPFLKVNESGGYCLGLKDDRTGEIQLDPIAVLEEFGIKTEKKLNKPQSAHVTLDTLINKGIDVEMLDFV